MRGREGSTAIARIRYHDIGCGRGEPCPAYVDPAREEPGRLVHSDAGLVVEDPPNPVRARGDYGGQRKRGPGMRWFRDEEKPGHGHGGGGRGGGIESEHRE